MPKKITKTTEELSEEFFARERTEYEKRANPAFPRVPVAKSAEPSELPDFEDSPPPPAEPVEDLPVLKPGLKA